MILLLLALSLGSLLASGESRAASACVVDRQEGNYLVVKVDGVPRIALSRDQFERCVDEREALRKAQAQIRELEARERESTKLIATLKQQLEENKARAKAYGALVDEYQSMENAYRALSGRYQQTLDESVGLNERYRTSSTQLLGLTDQYQQLVRDYDELAGKYRSIAMDSSSFISFDVGIGATSRDGNAEVAGLVGLGIKQFRLWGFLQNANSGVLAGASFAF